MIRLETSIKQAGFLQHSKIVKIISLLDKSLFVGGCVRDCLLGKNNIVDIDIATSLPPTEAINILQKNGFHPVPTGLKHGTFSLFFDDYKVEITTLRKDVNSINGRFAIINYTDDWTVDASRRDFTVNALYADIFGNVYDFLDGVAFSDLTHKQLRFIGNPTKKIDEDHLRILRFFRFFAVLGFDLDKQSLQACFNNSSKILNLSRERVSAELRKILLSSEPIKTLNLILKHNILQQFLVNTLDIENNLTINTDTLNNLISLEQYLQSEFSSMNIIQEYLPSFNNRIIALFATDTTIIDRFNTQLKSSNKEIKEQKIILQALYLPNTSECKYRYGKKIALLTYLLKLSLNFKKTDLMVYLKTKNETILHNINYIEDTSNKFNFTLPITGQDLLNLGLSPSPDIGLYLEKAHTLFIQSNYTLTKKELLNQLLSSQL